MAVNRAVFLLIRMRRCMIEPACIQTVSPVVVRQSQEWIMSEDTVRLARSGHEPLEIGISQVTTATLARVFSVSEHNRTELIMPKLLSACLLYYTFGGPHHFLRCEGYSIACVYDGPSIACSTSRK